MCQDKPGSQSPSQGEPISSDPQDSDLDILFPISPYLAMFGVLKQASVLSPFDHTLKEGQLLGALQRL